MKIKIKGAIYEDDLEQINEDFEQDSIVTLLSYNGKRKIYVDTIVDTDGIYLDELEWLSVWLNAGYVFKNVDGDKYILIKE